MLLIGTATELRTRVFRLVSIGCGLGVANLGLIDIPLLLTNSVIGLGERGRVLLISIWLAALGARCWPTALPRCGCVRSGGGGMRALAPWSPAGSDWTATDVLAEYADEPGDDLYHSHGSTSRVNDHWAHGCVRQDHPRRAADAAADADADA